MKRDTVKTEYFGRYAQEAWDAGATVFTPKIHYSVFGVTGRADGVANAVESIIAVGWKLQGWTAVPDRKRDNPIALPLFVRP